MLLKNGESRACVVLGRCESVRPGTSLFRYTPSASGCHMRQLGSIISHWSLLIPDPESMPVRRWANVADVGSSLGRHWIRCRLYARYNIHHRDTFCQNSQQQPIQVAGAKQLATSRGSFPKVYDWYSSGMLILRWRGRWLEWTGRVDLDLVQPPRCASRVHWWRNLPAGELIINDSRHQVQVVYYASLGPQHVL